MSKRIGIEIGNCKTKIVVMKISKLKKEVINHKIIDTVEGVFNHNGDVDVLKMEAPIRDALKAMKISAGQLYFAINHDSVIIRTRKLPYSEDAMLENLVRFEAENFLPYGIDEFHIDYKILSVEENIDKDHNAAEDGQESTGEDKKKFLQNVMVVAAPKGIVDQYTELARALKLKLKVLTVYTEAMDRYLCVNGNGANKNVLYVDIGKSYLNMIMYAKCEYFANLRSHYGVEYLLDEVVRVTGQSEDMALRDIFDGSPVEMEEAEMLAIENGHQKLAEEISKMVDFFKSREYGAFVDEIQLLGGGAKLKGFMAYLKETVNIDVKILDNPHVSKNLSHSVCQSIIPAIGVCLNK